MTLNFFISRFISLPLIGIHIHKFRNGHCRKLQNPSMMMNSALDNNHCVSLQLHLINEKYHFIISRILCTNVTTNLKSSISLLLFSYRFPYINAKVSNSIKVNLKTRCVSLNSKSVSPTNLPNRSFQFLQLSQLRNAYN